MTKRPVQVPRPRQAKPGLPRRWLIGGVAAAAAAVVVGLILASQLGGSSSKPSTTVAGASATAALLDGIPQQGIALGKPDAPVTLVEYADLQCPYCAEWARVAFPGIVADYVRPGKVRLVFRGLRFIGPESEVALRAALAAGAQARLWNVLELLYENQGKENAGWVTEDFLRAVGRSVPGLDVKRMLTDRASAAVDAEIAAAEDQATAAGIDSTPSFQIGRADGTLERLTVGSLDESAFRPALDALLAR